MERIGPAVFETRSKNSTFGLGLGNFAEFARGIKCEGILHHTVNNVIHSLVSNQATHNVTLILVSKTTPHREANLMILE